MAIKWLRDQLNLIADAAETRRLRALQWRRPGCVRGSGLHRIGRPHWQPSVRGLITGLTLDSNRDQVITATLQSVVLQTQELLQAMAQDGASVETLRIDGGMVVNDACANVLLTF
ncbi:MAG: hypothetical protein CM15mP120_12200 [Pseudomonadota bacterium]|nr:MAG: hypothetical protein CM15mP120_12200 [Pseudomonadota bacterium]